MKDMYQINCYIKGWVKDSTKHEMVTEILGITKIDNDTSNDAIGVLLDNNNSSGTILLTQLSIGVQGYANIRTMDDGSSIILFDRSFKGIQIPSADEEHKNITQLFNAFIRDQKISKIIE